MQNLLAKGRSLSEHAKAPARATSSLQRFLLYAEPQHRPLLSEKHGKRGRWQAQSRGFLEAALRGLSQENRIGYQNHSRS